MDGHGGPWNSKALAEPVEAVGTAEDRGVPRGTAQRRGLVCEKTFELCPTGTILVKKPSQKKKPKHVARLVRPSK